MQRLYRPAALVSGLLLALIAAIHFAALFRLYAAPTPIALPLIAMLAVVLAVMIAGVNGGLRERPAPERTRLVSAALGAIPTVWRYTFKAYWLVYVPLMFFTKLKNEAVREAVRRCSSTNAHGFVLRKLDTPECFTAAADEIAGMTAMFGAFALIGFLGLKYLVPAVLAHERTLAHVESNDARA